MHCLTSLCYVIGPSIFVLGKKENQTKKRMKDEEIENGEETAHCAFCDV